MTLPKISLIVGGAVIAVGAGAYVMWGELPGQRDGENILLNDYQEFWQELKDTETGDDLADSCENSAKFSGKINDLENRLSDLQKRKKELNELRKEAQEMPEIQDDSQPLELSDGVEESIPQLPDIPEHDIQNQIPELPDIPEHDINNDVPQLPDVPEHDFANIFDQINDVEKRIIAEIGILKSLCDEDEVVSVSCPEACKKYSDCAEYTEGVTVEDIKDAYDSCMEECVKWSDKTKICINKKKIREPLDCRDLSFCVLPEYGGPGVEVLK